MNKPLGVWFPTVRTTTGTDVFTERLVKGLNRKGIKAEIFWLPPHAEYAPWLVSVPEPPKWATVVHVNTWLHSRFLPRALPVIATLHHSIHDPILRPYKGWARAAYHRWWIAPNERRVMKHVDQTVAVSHFAAKIARRTLADIPMQVIHNGIDTQKFLPPGDRAPHQPFRLLYVGSWMARKGVDLLAPIMKELGKGYELYFTGGPAAESNKLEMPENMYDLGRLTTADAVIAAMQSADALLFPSRSEGFGLVAAEAMACGLPVIATRGSSLVEVVQNGLTGTLCEKDNIQCFAAIARKLASKPDLLSSLAYAGRKYVIDHFTNEAMEEAYIELYQHLVRYKSGSNATSDTAQLPSTSVRHNG